MSYTTRKATKITQTSEEVNMTSFHCDVCGDCLVEPNENYGDALTELIALKGIQKIKDFKSNQWLYSCCHKTSVDFRSYLKAKRIQKGVAEACAKANEQAARASQQGPGCHCAICSQLHPALPAGLTEVNLLEFLRLLQGRG